MKQKFKRSFIAVCIIVCILLTQSVFAENTAAVSENSAEYLKSVMEMIKDKYNWDVSEEQLIEGALKGMFGTMDQYTQYMTNDEEESFENGIDGNFYGIGILMQKTDKYIMVQKVYSGSPAEKAGLYPGDRLVSVNGKSIVGATTDETSKLIKGPAGKKVTLEVQRGLKNKAIKIEAVTGQVNISPVEYEIRNGIAYLRLSSFGTNADKELSGVLDKIDKANVKKIVLDIRDNPGGYLNTAIAISKRFVPKGIITKVDYKSEYYPDEVYMSELESVKYKLAVLVNGNSASCSEIFAGAVQDTKAGKLIGTKTFGKARVQSLIPILKPEAFKKYEEQTGAKVVDAYELITEYGVNPTTDEVMGYSKMTTGVYTTPNGRMIDLKGLTPDYVVPDPAAYKGVNINEIQSLKMISGPKLNEAGKDVFSAEIVLKLLGYNVDEADSFLDTKTFDAMKKFQKTKGITPNGSLDSATQKLINGELEKLRSKVDKQYAKALEVLNK